MSALFNSSFNVRSFQSNSNTDLNESVLLKTQLRNDLRARVPTDAYKTYEKVIDSLQDELCVGYYT